MVSLGFYKVKSFGGVKDSQGFSVSVEGYRADVPDASYTIYLPPLMRQSTSAIQTGSTLFCIVDSVIGEGCALYSEDADFTYSFDAEITIGKSLSVKDDISSQNGDVLAGIISLKNHTHPITAAEFTGTINPQTGAATGTISGDTGKPV